LTGIAPTQISAEVLDLFGATVGILRQRRLRAFVSKVLAGLS